MKITEFEDLEIWNLSVQHTKSIYALTNSAKFRKDFELSRQIRRASISVSSNIAEGFERDNNKSFIYFLNVAKGSLAEVISQLHVAYVLGYCKTSDYLKLKNEAKRINANIGGFILYLKKFIEKNK